MAIIQAICNSYKQDILRGVQSAVHEYKIALFTKKATLNKDTTTYLGQTDEIKAEGYLTGGKRLEGFKVNLKSNTAILDWEIDPVWGPGATITARGALIYNNSLIGKNSIMVLDFGMDYSCKNDYFILDFPPPTLLKGLIRLGG